MVAFKLRRIGGEVFPPVLRSISRLSRSALLWTNSVSGRAGNQGGADIVWWRADRPGQSDKTGGCFRCCVPAGREALLRHSGGGAAHPCRKFFASSPIDKNSFIKPPKFSPALSIGFVGTPEKLRKQKKRLEPKTVIGCSVSISFFCDRIKLMEEEHANFFEERLYRLHGSKRHRV